MIQRLSAYSLRFCLAAVLIGAAEGALAAELDRLEIEPRAIVLEGLAARQQLSVTGWFDERPYDLNRDARFTSNRPDVARVDRHGVVTPVSDGTAAVSVVVHGETRTLPVRVAANGVIPKLSFERHVQPILTRFGCNSGPCHGKQRGQNGFQLSLLGFDDDSDFRALAHELAGRRLQPADPPSSLLLLKGTASIPHGGGRRLDPDGIHADVIEEWIAQGTPRRATDDPVVERISLFPTERLLAPDDRLQLRVTAHYTDGSQHDVTHLAAYQSSDAPVAAVDEFGLVQTGALPGEAAIMARYQNLFATTALAIPLAGDVPSTTYTTLPRRNFIDDLVWQKLERLGIVPSPPASDAAFLRRAYLDAIGRLPTAAEARTFLADKNPKKKEQLVDRLLERPEYVDFWANKWADLLRPNPYRVGIKTVRSLDRWIRSQFRRNARYDEFVRGLLTARGSAWQNGAATIFRDRRSPDEITTMVSQLFLGIRLECAKCHHHPFEIWGQDDFYSLAAYFSRVGRKGPGLSPPISGGEEMIFTAATGRVTHPRTGEVLSPRPLFGTAPPVESKPDPREAFAEWVTRDNEFFARVQVNRVWADLMGRGLVEPIDDLRTSNPPTNEALLAALARDFRQHDYDLKHLLRRIMTSHVYGLSDLPHERNLTDTRNYSRHYRQRLRAEVILDAISDVAEVPERFDAMPPHSRAVALWTVRSTSLFLDTFGRPDPNQDPPCERTPDTTVVQALHLMNAPQLYRKVTSEEARAARLANSEKTADEIVEEIYLSVYSRFPTMEERQICLEILGDGSAVAQSGSGQDVNAGDSDKQTSQDRRRAIEDLLWALLNTPEFVFKN